LGVDLFFIISGFVILLSTANKNALGFSISRITRLFPAFWVAVTLTTVLLWLFAIPKTADISWYQYLVNMTMVPEYFGVENIDTVYWTLQVEIKFYFWIFLIMLFNKIEYIERFVFVWLIMAIFEIFHFIHGFTHQFLIPEWAPYFGAGALFFRIHQEGFNWQRGVMLALAYVLSLYYAVEGANMRTEEYGMVFSPVVVMLLTTGFFLFFILIVTKKKAGVKRVWYTVLGVITYPLYLIHDAIGQLFFYYFGQSINKYLLLFLVTAIMIALSYIIYRYFELGFSKKMKNALVNLTTRVGDRLAGSSPIFHVAGNKK
jgi:peptidoglycan/LPS O-acetylase OafA/YrhL